MSTMLATSCRSESPANCICRFLDQNLGFACGGSGTLFRTDDGGKSWKRDRATDDIAGNLYAIKFFPQSDNGFILGNAGILLRYIA